MAERSPKRSKVAGEGGAESNDEWFRGRSVLSMNDFSRERIDRVFEVALRMKTMVEEKGGCDVLKGKVMSTVFYEPSTRTHSSFQAAMFRLGGQVIVMSDMSNTSVKKGETLDDTMKCVECYSDLIVLRHPTVGAAKQASDAVAVPVFNGGDGAGEHPTQALLDAFTIQAELGTIDGLTVSLVGDLKHGRTVHSLSKLLSLYNVTINYVAPACLGLPKSIQEHVTKKEGVVQHETEDILTVLPDTDILYVTRIQKERFVDPAEYDKVSSCYIITPELLDTGKAKETLRILHPLPRVNEISPKVDSDPRAAYFRQMRNGMYVRMALLALAFGVADKV